MAHVLVSIFMFNMQCLSKHPYNNVILQKCGIAAKPAERLIWSFDLFKMVDRKKMKQQKKKQQLLKTSPISNIPISPLSIRSS